uniref:hypothetical protein n=1 Tax=Roseivirga sp. TaxID=1964215 RepID=UPI0040484549
MKKLVILVTMLVASNLAIAQSYYYKAKEEKPGKARPRETGKQRSAEQRPRKGKP